jgi:cytochrome o ubiquinol oxidase operon protein cyoD
MSKDIEIKNTQYGAGKGTLTTYIVGFLLSLELTIAAYLLVSRHVHSHHAAFSHKYLIAMLIGLAVSQLMVQLVFFLHLSRESKPRWNLTVFSFAILVVLIVVIGSLWIMNNLNYHHGDTMTPEEIIKDEGIKE